MIYPKHTIMQLKLSNDYIANMSARLEEQALKLQDQKDIYHNSYLDEIGIKYPPPTRWNDYCELKKDIEPYLENWFAALERLKLTNRDKVLCTFIYLYPYISVVELAKCMCMTKAAVQVRKSNIAKKLGITATQLINFLQKLPNER
jgi:hypothetical protein